MRIIFLTALFFCFAFGGNALEIECENAEYANEKLDFYVYTDPVSRDTELLFSLQFNAVGKANTNVAVENTTFVFSEFGVYRGFLLLEAAGKIIINLPPAHKKSFADEKNPFFEPIQFWLKVENEHAIQSTILAFEIKFQQLTNTYFNQLYYQQSNAFFDTLLTRLNHELKMKNDYLEMHKNFQVKSLQMDVFRLKPEKIAGVFMGTEPFFWNHPAYMQLFEKCFSNSLGFEAKEVTGGSIKKAVAENNVTALLNWIQKKYGLTGKMADLALLKMLHDGFYSGDFNKSDILKLISSPHFSQNKNSEINEIAIRTAQKLQHLQPNTKAPVICLKNIDGHRKCSDQENEKYKYVVFADAEIGICREHLKYLSAIDDRFQKHLDIILVMKKTDLIEMKMFLVENEIRGEKLVDENNEYITRYKVKSFPQCFLLDSRHNVVFEDTKAPLDGFEQQFGPFLQTELFKQQRNQSR